MKQASLMSVLSLLLVTLLDDATTRAQTPAALMYQDALTHMGLTSVGFADIPPELTSTNRPAK